jgi:hypothetical protein
MAEIIFPCNMTMLHMYLQLLRQWLCCVPQLAEKKWGVIGISWRDVPCWQKPKTVAKQPWWAKPTPTPSWYKKPWNWNKYMVSCKLNTQVASQVSFALKNSADMQPSALVR